MPENNDINYQPQTQGFSFSDKEIQKEKRKTEFKSFFINLFLGLLTISFFLLVIFFSFNYFRIFSLSKLNPVFTNLPQIKLPPAPLYNVENKTWTVSGTLSQYDNEKIRIKLSSLKTMEFIFNQDSNLLINEKTQQSLGTLYDLDQQKNLGKKAEVEYYIKDKSNFINKITLFK